MDLISLFKNTFNNNECEILDSPKATHQYGQTTFSLPVEISAGIIVYETSTIATLLKIANDYKFHIFPISSGNNWGYGSVQDLNSTSPLVVLDLSKLNMITPTSKGLGLITLQPGVTQQELYHYLKDNDWPFMTPVTGAGPSCSIVGNAIERGYGITPRADHFLAVNALKAYLPHPDLCQSLYSSAVSELDKSGNDFIDKTFKWGLGPYLDGIFTQSNFGIVTEMTVRLAPRPKHFSAFYIKVTDDKYFEKCVLFIKQFLLQFEGTVGSINLMDKNRLISMTSENPNTPSAHRTMSSTQIKNIVEKNKLPCWMIVGSLYGDSSTISVAKKTIKRQMNKYGSIYFSDSKLIKFAKAILDLPLPSIGVIKVLREQFSSISEGTDIMLGIPNQVALPLAYWRNPRKKPDKSTTLQPDKDGCGLLWYAPLIPMGPKELQEFVNFVRSTTPKYNIEPLITFTNLKHDCIDATVPIVFDLENEEALSTAHACLDDLIQSGRKRGFVPYRLNPEQQSKLDKNAVFWQVSKKIKQTLDPNNIISPNRYTP